MEEQKNQLLNKSSLVDWKNPPTVADLKADYDEAYSSHSSHLVEVEGWLEAYNGTLKVDPPKGRSRVQPKLIRKQAEWRYAALSEPFLSEEDMFDVYPVTHLDKEQAFQNQLVLNKQFSVDIDKTAFIDEVVRTAVDEGTVILKVGWYTEEGEVEEEVEVPKYASPEESMMVLQSMVESGQMTPEEAQAYLESGKPVQVGVDYQIKKVVKEIANKPTVEVKDYRTVIIDPSCEGDMSKAKFIIDRFTTDMATLKKDGRYKNLDNIRPSDNTPLSEADYPAEETGFNFRDKPRQKVVVYEYWGYWDIDDSGLVTPIVAAFIGDTMVRLEENPFPDKKLPFIVIPYLPRRKQIYGEPDGSLLVDNQDIIGAVTRGMIDILGRSANGQMGIRKDALDTANFAKFEKGEDYKFNPSVDPKQAFQMSVYPEIPRSALEVVNIQNAEAESLTGIKAFTQGISGNALGDSVGGIRSALDATAKRELGILRRLSKGIIELGKKIIAMNAVWLSEEEVIRTTDKEFVRVKRDDLAGDFDIRLSISTPETDNMKAQELAFMLQTMGNSLPLEMSQMVLADIARLRKMPRLAERIESYQPQPDPMQQKMQELQIAKLEAELFNEQQKGLENQMDVRLKAAKAQFEEARARKMNSDADVTDLDFLEKGQGLQHEREMEKILTQEGSKQQLEGMKQRGQGQNLGQPIQ